MRRIPIFVLMLLLASGCSREASAPAAQASPTGGTRLCRAADLQTSSNSNGATGAIQLGMTLVNISNSPCDLVGPPQVTLLGGGRALDVQVLQAAADQTPPAPAALTLAPGDSVIEILVWRNYCGAALADGPVIHLALTTDQALEIGTAAQDVPRCDAQNQTSTLTVNPYSFPP